MHFAEYRRIITQDKGTCKRRNLHEDVTWSWRVIYANNEGAFEGMINQMLQQANSYGYADCVKWCEEQAALCWAAQQAQAAAAE